MKWLWILVFVPCLAFSQAREKFSVDTTATTAWRARGKDATFTRKIVWLNVVAYGTSTTDTLWLAYQNDTTATKNSVGTGKLIPVIPGETGVWTDDVSIEKFWVKKTGSGTVTFSAVFH